MYSHSAEFYDLIYTGVKDYQKEAGYIAGVVRKYHKNPGTILDVACGTGSHAFFLKKDHGFQVDGLDREINFVRIARRKLPNRKMYCADMSSFEIERKYDVILCLFSSIGYMKTAKEMRKTLAQFKKHLKKKGVVIVEPWLTPEKFQPGHFDLLTVNRDDIKLCRMAHVKRKHKISKVEFHYLVARKSGLRHFSEIHELGLFTGDEMKKIFTDTGFQVDYEDEGPTGRGLYVGYSA